MELNMPGKYPPAFTVFLPKKGSIIVLRFHFFGSEFIEAAIRGVPL
jgi:hypothetical protein